MKKIFSRILIMLLTMSMVVGMLSFTVFAEETQTTVTNESGIKGGFQYSDVSVDDWFYDDVMQVYDDGLMTGKNANDFKPYDPLTRSEFAVILYRREGKPDVTYSSDFPDIPNGEWYTDACIWANNSGLITGYDNGYFGPADYITREQVATILYRYAGSIGIDLTPYSRLQWYEDYKNVSDWAYTALSWCGATGIIRGKCEGKNKFYGDSYIDPAGNTLRCECAAIINRFKHNEEHPAVNLYELVINTLVSNGYYFGYNGAYGSEVWISDTKAVDAVEFAGHDPYEFILISFSENKRFGGSIYLFSEEEVIECLKNHIY